VILGQIVAVIHFFFHHAFQASPNIGAHPIVPFCNSRHRTRHRIPRSPPELLCSRSRPGAFVRWRSVFDRCIQGFPGGCGNPPEPGEGLGAYCKVGHPAWRLRHPVGKRHTGPGRPGAGQWVIPFLRRGMILGKITGIRPCPTSR
jgi:hypothetical protein